MYIPSNEMFLCCFFTLVLRTQPVQIIWFLHGWLSVLTVTPSKIKIETNQTLIQKVQNVFLETLPAKLMITSCKNRFLRQQKTYYAMEVFTRWVNKLLVMTRGNGAAIRYFCHNFCHYHWSQPRPQGLLVFQYDATTAGITRYFFITTNNSS